MASRIQSMAVTHPELAAEFHPTKNGDLTADDVTASTSKKLWWKCPKADDHEWETTAGKRSRRGQGCPACSGHLTVPSTSLATTHPDLAAELHPTKNGDLRPQEIGAGSAKKLWWKCPKADDHEWQARPSKRSGRGDGCPACAGKLTVPSTSIATTHPEIAAQLHPTKNGDLRPQEVGAGTHKRLWWKCPEADDHEWETTIHHRTERGQGCPACSGRLAVPSNCLATTHPELATELHQSKNGDTTANNITAGTHTKLWWKCPNGDDHEWQTTVRKRAVRGQGCPYCNTGWTIQSVRSFVSGLLESGIYGSLTPAELWVLFQQNGLPAKPGSKRHEFVKALGTSRLGSEDLESFAAGNESPIDDLIEGTINATELLEDLRTDDREDGDDLDPFVDEDLEESAELPEWTVSDALDVMDSSIWASGDVEAVEFLQSSAIRKMWQQAYDPEQLENVQQESAVPRQNTATESCRAAFRSELEAALSMEIPEGYDFRIDGELIEPLLMQKHVATKVRDAKRFGNWSGTGAGKTLSAVLASRLVGADLTVICCPNATILGWESTITNAFPNAQVLTKTLAPKWDSRAVGPHYLLVNFEAFQQPNSEADLHDLIAEIPIDMVVVDEIHYAKQRSEDASKRRTLVNGLISAASERKSAQGSDLFVLGMSATPVINNLREGVSMVELLTGIEHDDLETRTSVANAMRVYQRLTTLGTRWMPPYPNYADLTPRIDISHRFEEILALDSRSPLSLEQILLEEKLDTIVDNIATDGTGTVIYSEYVAGMVPAIVEAVSAAGHSVGTYTGQDKTGLDPFLRGETRVLVGSSTIGTGVDGLQHVASRLIVASAPWTSAAFEQLVGRLVRTGQQDQVEVVFPITYIDTPEGEWSYDEGNRLNRIKYKKTIADAAVDGIVPEGALRTPEQAMQDALGWLQRLSEDGMETTMRRVITVPLSGERNEVDRRASKYGEFSEMNRRWNTSKSATTHERLSSNPEEWENYHTLYRAARESWSWVPFAELAAEIAKGSKNRVVADFGCGEDRLGQLLRSDGFTVHSFDHIAISPDVVEVDIAAGVPLDDDEIDVAVFSLSLMGTNNGDYLREAARCLAYDGRLHIVETKGHFDKLADDEIEVRLGSLGFTLTGVERVGQPEFVHIKGTRNDQAPDSGVDLL